MSDYRNRALWYALWLCIIKKISADEALKAMGENFN